MSVAPVPDLEKYVDMDDALKRVCGNKMIYKRLLDTFRKGLQYDQLHKEAEAGDAEAASHTAHSIKGVAANLSLKAAYHKVMEVEVQLKAGEINMADIEELGEILNITVSCTEYLRETI